MGTLIFLKQAYLAIRFRLKAIRKPLKLTEIAFPFIVKDNTFGFEQFLLEI